MPPLVEKEVKSGGGCGGGGAGKGGKLIRGAVRILLQNAKDKRVVSRLVKSLLEVAKKDPLNERGHRTIEDGNMSLLLGFDFNVNGKLGSPCMRRFLLPSIG